MSPFGKNRSYSILYGFKGQYGIVLERNGDDVQVIVRLVEQGSFVGHIRIRR